MLRMNSTDSADAVESRRALHFYQDQFLAGAKCLPLDSTPRMLLVRHGAISVAGQRLGEMGAVYAADDAVIEGLADWSEVWRWELRASEDLDQTIHGAETHSVRRMRKVITTFDMPSGSSWLFRLDRIKMAAGRVTDPHVHPGPGIRCLLEGSFSAEQASEPVSWRLPGETWWESGTEEVVSRASPTMRTRFMRGMILPRQFATGGETASWLNNKNPPPSDNWTLFVDHIVSL
jgi:hypothetical protein